MISMNASMRVSIWLSLGAFVDHVGLDHETGEAHLALKGFHDVVLAQEYGLQLRFECITNPSTSYFLIIFLMILSMS